MEDYIFKYIGVDVRAAREIGDGRWWEQQNNQMSKVLVQWWSLPGSQEYDQLYGRHLRSNCVIGPDLSIQLKYQGKQQKQLQSNRSERKIKMM